ncbi:DNA polymerase theta isoform X3 [Nematostella vectensis]|uniref:DNA polymerase theta isoform X3 n=1 Tax=Nematostella vectensis TaxID=45351 RepID=UPI0020772C61|nr:DNA polymerase theta isoform X3 [Nematostella vectensis]
MKRLSQTWKQKRPSLSNAKTNSTPKQQTHQGGDKNPAFKPHSVKFSSRETQNQTKDSKDTHARKAQNATQPDQLLLSPSSSFSMSFDFDAAALCEVDKMEKDLIPQATTPFHTPTSNNTNISPLSTISLQTCKTTKCSNLTKTISAVTSQTTASIASHKTPQLGQHVTPLRGRERISTPVDEGEHVLLSSMAHSPAFSPVTMTTSEGAKYACPSERKRDRKSPKQTSGESYSSSSDQSHIILEPNPSAQTLELASWGLPPAVLQRYHDIGITHMFQWQADCLCTGNVLQGGNLVYSAPTSAGKTMVAELLMLKRVLETKRKALLILPFVSVAREKMFYLQRLFQESGVRVEGFMGSHSPAGGFAATDIAVCTIEKGNSLLNRLMEEGKVSTLGTVVIDELHMVGDPNRGYLLELFLTKIRYLSSQEEVHQAAESAVQIVGMSATLPNLDMLSSWLGANLYHTTFRPVPLTEMVKIGPTIYDTDLKKLRDIDQSEAVARDDDHVIPLCKETISQGHSVLIFCPTKNWCEKQAEAIARHFAEIGSAALAAKNGQGTGFVRASDLISFDYESLREVFEQLKRTHVGLDSVLMRTIPHAVAFHHAGLTFDERDIIEGAFRQGTIRVLVATSTLCSGVNLPARRVVIRTPTFHGRMVDPLVYKQMAGRAGRKGVDALGESVLICKTSERAKATTLMKSSLNAVESCLLDKERTGGLKRALLEVIASGVVTGPRDVESYAACTFFASSSRDRDVTSESAIPATIRFLVENEFVRLVTSDAKGEGEGDAPPTDKYVPTQLGAATVVSALSPDEALAVFAELQKARKCFVLESELHVIYQVTPIYIQAQWPNIDWDQFHNTWERMPSHMRRVADIVGIKESYIALAARGRIPTRTEQHRQQLAVHRRFFAALALQDLVHEVPLNVVARRYGATRGMIQSLQGSASTFAGMVTVFCQKLGWVNLELLLDQFQSRLSFGVERELCDLVRISVLNAARARMLYNSGFHTIALLAQASPEAVETVLRNAVPFISERKHQGETDLEVKHRRDARVIWVAGKRGLSEREAADVIVSEAKQLLQGDVAQLGVNWRPPEVAQKHVPNRESASKTKACNSPTSASDSSTDSSKLTPRPALGPRSRLLGSSSKSTRRLLGKRRSGNGKKASISPPHFNQARRRSARDKGKENEPTDSFRSVQGPDAQQKAVAGISVEPNVNDRSMHGNRKTRDTRHFAFGEKKNKTGSNSCVIQRVLPSTSGNPTINDQNNNRKINDGETSPSRSAADGRSSVDDVFDSDHGSGGVTMKGEGSFERSKPTEENCDYLISAGMRERVKNSSYPSERQEKDPRVELKEGKLCNNTDIGRDTDEVLTIKACDIIVQERPFENRKVEQEKTVRTKLWKKPKDYNPRSVESHFTEKVAPNLEGKIPESRHTVVFSCNAENNQTSSKSLAGVKRCSPNAYVGGSPKQKLPRCSTEIEQPQNTTSHVRNCYEESERNHSTITDKVPRSIGEDFVKASHSDAKTNTRSAGDTFKGQTSTENHERPICEDLEMFSESVSIQEESCSSAILFDTSSINTSGPKPEQLTSFELYSEPVEDNQNAPFRDEGEGFEMPESQMLEFTMSDSCIAMCGVSQAHNCTPEAQQKTSKETVANSKECRSSQNENGVAISNQHDDRKSTCGALPGVCGPNKISANVDQEVSLCIPPRIDTGTNGIHKEAFKNMFIGDEQFIAPRNRTRDTAKSVKQPKFGIPQNHTGSHEDFSDYEGLISLCDDDIAQCVELTDPDNGDNNRNDVITKTDNDVITKTNDVDCHMDDVIGEFDSYPQYPVTGQCKTQASISAPSPSVSSMRVESGAEVSFQEKPDESDLEESGSFSLKLSFSESQGETQLGEVEEMLHCSKNEGVIEASPEAERNPKFTLVTGASGRVYENDHSKDRQKICLVENTEDIEAINDTSQCFEAKFTKLKSKPSRESVAKRQGNGNDVLFQDRLKASDLDARLDVKTPEADFIPSSQNGARDDLGSFPEELLSPTATAQSPNSTSSGESVSIIDLCANKLLFETFIQEWKTRKMSAFAVACERLLNNVPKIGSRFDNGPVLRRTSKGLDIEGTDEVVVGLAVCWGSTDSYFMSLMDPDSDETFGTPRSSGPAVATDLSVKYRVDAIKSVLESKGKRSGIKICFDYIQQCKALCQGCGITVSGECEDPKVASWLLDPGCKEKTLQHLVGQYASSKMVILEGTGGGSLTGSLALASQNTLSGRVRACTESVLVFSMMKKLRLDLAEDGLDYAFQKVEMPVMQCLVRMELNGFGFSEAECDRLKAILQAKLRTLEQEAYRLANHSFSLTSPDDVARVLFLELRLPVDGKPDETAAPARRTLGSSRRGASAAGRRKTVKHISTNKEVLERLKSLHPLPRIILEWRRVNCALTKVVFPVQREKLFHKSLHMSRIYPTSQTHTTTGRVSFNEPNLQNVPRDFEIELPSVIAESPPLGTRRRENIQKPARSDHSGMSCAVSMRTAFVPCAGGVLLAADYSQLELRLIAHLADDSRLRKVLNGGGDVFRMIAGSLAGLEPGSVDDKQRQRAKQICYGIIYGIGAKALGEQLELGEEDASMYIEKFKSRFSGIRRYLKSTVEQCRKTGVSGRSCQDSHDQHRQEITRSFPDVPSHSSP